MPDGRGLDRSTTDECPSAALALDGAVKPLLAWHANGNAAKDFFYSLLGDLCRGKAGFVVNMSHCHKHTSPDLQTQVLALTDLCVLLCHKYKSFKR